MTIRKKFFLAAVLIIAGTLAALVILMSRSTPEEPLPNPNGYDDFVKAAALIDGNSTSWNDLSPDGWRSLVATNQPALAQVRSALQKECRVVPYDLIGTNPSHMNDLSAFKRTAHAFAVASKLAVTSGHTNEAALLGLDCIRFGHASARGGVLIDGMLALGIQAIGRTRLAEALPGVDVDTSRKLVAGLEDVATRYEQPDDIWKREAQWAQRGRFGQMNFIAAIVRPFMQRDMQKKANQKLAKGFSELQQTKLHAAAHAYELDHGKPPAAAHDLVPQYLKSVPLDPATAKELPLN